MDACVIGEITREDEEKSFSDDGITEDRGVFASLDVLKLGCESFKAVKELGGFLGFLGSASHPGDLGVLEDGLGLELFVKSVKELLVGGLPSRTQKILNVPVLGRDAGRGCFYRAENAKEGPAILGTSWRVLGLKEGNEGPPESIVVLIVFERGNVRGSEEF